MEIINFYENIGSNELSDNEKIFIEFQETIRRDNEEDKSHKFKSGDIYKMHTYKDAILRTEGAYVLYPGSREDIFKVDEIDAIPSVGAFPLNPGENGNEENSLSEFIKAILSKFII